MSLPAPPTRTNHDRAKMVCIQCHARKVKCDLQRQPGGICSNCRRRNQICQRRDDSRSSVGYKRTAFEAFEQPSSPVIVQSRDSMANTARPLRAVQSLASPDESRLSETTLVTNDPSGYVGEQSLMSRPSPPVSIVLGKKDGFSEKVNDELMKLTGAASLPPRVMIEALADAFFKYLYHRMPIIDRRDIFTEQPSVLLSQGLCLVGSLLRHPKESSRLVSSEQFYTRLKTLLFVDYEKDNLTTLKVLCLLGCWNKTPPAVINLDCTWHWIGVAIRFAFGMGLHRESTHLRMLNSGVTRRLAWYLFTHDKIQSACFGRPAFIKADDFDVRPLALEDFETVDEQAEIFVAFTHLGKVLSRIVEFRTSPSELSSKEALSILNALEDWINELPEKVRLYDSNGYRMYRRGIYEVHICYFVSIIIFFHTCGHAIQSVRASLASLIASSCIARLYEEMDYRDDINYLMAVNNWFLMVGCIPQICYMGGPNDHDQLCVEELNILIAALKQMRIKWPQANHILGAVDRLRGSKNNTSPRISQSFIYRAAAGDKDYISGSSQTRSVHLHNLFPFPKQFSPRMGLLDQEIRVQRDPSTVVAVTPPHEEVIDWVFDEFNLDIFEMPFSDFPSQFDPIGSTSF